MTRKEVATQFKSIKLLAIDVDGVLTDDSIYFGPEGLELKKFNISDGFYMVLAMRSGLELAIVSGRYSPATDSRMKDLGVKHILQGKKDKVAMVKPLLEELKIDFSDVAFIGNELLDIKLAKYVGLPIAVADAVDDLKDICAFVTSKAGGDGALRELLEIYFEGVDKKPIDYLP